MSGVYYGAGLKSLIEAAGSAFGLDFSEEVIALVVNEDECGEVFDFNFPDSFHSELGIFEQFDFLDRVGGKHCCRTAD